MERNNFMLPSVIFISSDKVPVVEVQSDLRPPKR